MRFKSAVDLTLTQMVLILTALDSFDHGSLSIDYSEELTEARKELEEKRDYAISCAIAGMRT